MTKYGEVMEENCILVKTYIKFTLPTAFMFKTEHGVE